MNKVFACIDGRSDPAGVCDYAAWAALRLGAPLEFLHVLDRHPEVAPVSDLSGSIGVGTQESLLAELSALDEARSKLAAEHGRRVLEIARERAGTAGIVELDVRQRHGTLVETLLDLQAQARLIVMGQNHRIDSVGKIHLDHHVEQVVRTIQRPILIAGKTFKAPTRFVIAFDGSATGTRMLQALAQSPLLAGLPCAVVMAGDDSVAHRDQLEGARRLLTPAGFDVETVLLPGEPEIVILDFLKQHGSGMLVMGAYGHSRIRQLVVGSTTTTLLRTSPEPVLVLR
jgi:nucleotide-binding universal stress UspA family protein